MAQLCFNLLDEDAADILEETVNTTVKRQPQGFSNVFLLGDNEELHLSADQDGERTLRSYLEYRDESDVYHSVAVSNIFPIGVDGTNWNIPPYQTMGMEVVLPQLREDDMEDSRVLKEGGLFVAFPGPDGAVHRHLVRETAMRSLMESAGIACYTTLTRDSTRKADPLPLPIIADWFKTARAYRKNRAVVLIRDGAAIGRAGSIGYVGSESYAPLSPKAGLDVLLEVLREEHPEVVFKGGMISWTYLVAQYEIQDDLLMLLMEEALSAFDTVSDLECGVTYQTSEVGLCAMTARAYIAFESGKQHRRLTIPLPYPVKIEHQGAVTVDSNWREGLADFAHLFKDSLEAIERMGQVAIPKLGAALMDVQKHYPSELGRAATETAASLLDTEHPDGGTAVDVYLAAVNIADTASENTVAGFVAASEFTAMLPSLPWERIAKGEEWKRRKA